MELNSCSSQDDASTAFVRDWRRKISPVNNKLANQDTAPIVRRRTVITIGSVNESDGSTLQQEDQTISASEVGETACGRISITVKTIPKTPTIRAITEKSPIFSPCLNAEEEWTSTDTVPFKSSSVSDPSWIYVPSQSDRSYSSKIFQRPTWQDDKPSRDIDSTLLDNQKLCRTLSNKKSSYTLTEIDMGPSADSRKVNPDQGITNKVFNSPKINLKPTFKMTFGDETKILRLTDTSSSEKSVPKFEKKQTTSVARSPIGYHEWLKSLDRLEGESYPNQIHSSDDEKVKSQDTKLIKSIDRTPAVTAHKSSDIIQPLGLIEASPSKSILKTVQNECEIRPETVIKVQNPLHKEVTVGIVPQVSLEVHKSSLTKPINSLIDTKDKQDVNGKSSPCLVGWVAKSNITDSKFSKIVPVNGNQVAPKIADCTTSRLPTAVKVDRLNSIEVVNNNQINSSRSISSSGSWKNYSNTQDGMNGSALSSGMDLSKATELVRQFFNNGNVEDADNHQSSSLETDKKPLNVTKSNLLVEDPTLHSISHDYQPVAAQSTSNSSTEFQPGSVQDQQYVGHHRGRSTIKSKIPLRIPRTASSSACSHSGNISTLTAPPVAHVDKGNNIVSSKNCAFNKAKSTINMPSKIKPPSTGSAVRTRSVENLRQTSPLSSYVLYSNIMAARDDAINHYQ